VPTGAETTSPYFNKVGKYSYMSLVAQHPKVGDKQTITGYVGPFTMLGNN
jgi:hypothetical protein